MTEQEFYEKIESYTILQTLESAKYYESAVNNTLLALSFCFAGEAAVYSAIFAKEKCNLPYFDIVAVLAACSLSLFLIALSLAVWLQVRKKRFFITPNQSDELPFLFKEYLKVSDFEDLDSKQMLEFTLDRKDPDFCFKKWVSQLVLMLKKQVKRGDGIKKVILAIYILAILSIMTLAASTLIALLL